MTDFKKLKETCDANSKFSTEVIDNFLLNYAAAKDNLSREFDQKIAVYKHITQPTDKSWVNLMKSQYIIHKVFKADGLLRKYLNHSEVKRRPAEHQEFLIQQSATPWRFSFSIITGNPAQDFYQMEDVFSGDSFLVYSRQTTAILKEQSAMVWFNLIAFNGSCWQTFGPLGAYQSFDPDDIFFYATEVNPRIDSEESLLQDLERSPLPYLLLLSGSRLPSTMNKRDEILILTAEHPVETLDTSKLAADFKVEYNDGVFRLSLEEWTAPPHLADAYYDEEENLLTVTSMTDRGFFAFINKLNAFGLNLPPDAQVRIHPSMLITTERILKRKIVLNPYDKLFKKEASPSDKATFDKLNVFLKNVIEAVNAGKKPDFDTLAKEADVDPDSAREIALHTIARIEAMKKETR
jgi:hypothetical protein